MTINKAHKIITAFKLKEGKADEEIERCKSEDSLLNTLKKFPGFISYEVVKLNDSSTMNIQNWESKKHFLEAIPKAMAARSATVAGREKLVLSHENFSGEIILSSN